MPPLVRDQIAGDDAPGAGKHARGALRRLRMVACVLKSLPGYLVQKPLLGLHELGFPFRVSKKSGVEQVEALQNGGCPDVIRVVQERGVDTLAEELFAGEVSD